MSEAITQNRTEDLIDEISAVVGINFEPQTIQSALAESNYDFLSTIASLIRNYLKFYFQFFQHPKIQ